MNKESWCLMNLSNKTDQWRGKFKVKAKENQLNTSQSAEVGNHEVFVSNASLSDPGFENGRLRGEMILLGWNYGPSIYYRCDLRQVTLSVLSSKMGGNSEKRMDEKFLGQCLVLNKHSVEATASDFVWLLLSYLVFPFSQMVDKNYIEQMYNVPIGMGCQVWSVLSNIYKI